MRTTLTILVVLVLFAGIAFAAVIALTAPRPPVAMASVSRSFDGVDYSGMPDKRHFTARDGTSLVYRAYPGDPSRIVIVVHGSSGTTASVHPLARAIHARGATVYAVAIRGHDETGRSGDIDYVGQLDDDLVDFVKTLGPRTAGQTRTLLGFSSGGGFVLRFAGGPNGGLFDRVILVSPQLAYNAPTSRPGAGGWVSVSIPRIIALSLLSRIGITAFNGLPVLAMAVDPARLAYSKQTAFYSYRLWRNFGPSDDYQGDVKRFRGSMSLFVGAQDEIFHAEQYAPLLKPVRPDLTVTVLPGIDHMGMTLKPAALETIATAAN